MSTPLLYPYQRRYLRDASRFKAGLWSRQTGKTFTTALEAVLDVLEAEAEGRTSRWTILSVSRDRALDAMDNGVKLHLKAIGAAFTALDVPLAVDELAHVVRIGERGSYIRAIAARPETARGMSDNLILDEFAHHQDNRAIWTALFPVISRPGLKVRVISTPNGVGDKFHEIMTAPELAGLWSRHTVTIHDAVAEGLPRDIAELKLGMNDPDAWAQEFECAFLDNAARAWLPFDLTVRQQLYDWALDRFAPIHIRNAHGDGGAEAARGQIAVTAPDYARLPRLILEGRLSYAGKTDIGRDAVEIVAALEDAEYHAVFEILPKRRMLALKRLWKTGRPPSYVRNASRYDRNDGMQPAHAQDSR